jgi:hypothetical protein
MTRSHDAADALLAAAEALERQALELRRRAHSVKAAEPPIAWIGVKAAAFAIGRSQRQTYRIVEKIGVRVGRQWFVDPNLLAERTANDGERRR